jgi:hypothetical protein
MPILPEVEECTKDMFLLVLRGTFCDPSITSPNFLVLRELLSTNAKGDL